MVAYYRSCVCFIIKKQLAAVFGSGFTNERKKSKKKNKEMLLKDKTRKIPKMVKENEKLLPGIVFLETPITI